MTFASVGIATLVGVLMVCAPTWTVGQTHINPGTAAEDIRSLPLRDQFGESTTLRAFEGRTLLVNFIFTHCIAACHTQVKSLNSVRASLPPDIRARVQFLSISLDPDRDTPETLRQYAQVMGIDDLDWRFASASADDLAHLTQVLSVKRKSLPDGQIDHTLVVILFDAKGELIQRYAGAEVDATRLVREIGDVVKLFDPTYKPTSSIGPGR